MAKIEIEYCFDCMFLGRAIEVASALLNNHQSQIDALALIPGHDGIFTVRFNTSNIYEIGETGIPAKPEEILALIDERMG